MSSASRQYPDAGRPDRAARRRRRRRQCGREPSRRASATSIATMKALGRDRRRRLRRSICAQILLVPLIGDAARRWCSARRCRSSSPGCSARIIPLPVAPALLSRRRSCSRIALRAADRARLRAVAARPRARHLGVGAVPRRDRRRAALAAAALRHRHRIDHRRAGGAGGPARLRPAPRGDLRRLRGRRFRRAAARRDAGDGARAPRCRARARPRCAWPSPTSTGRAR